MPMPEIVGYTPDGDLIFDVKIIASKFSYGRTDFKITPVAGVGEKWVYKNKLKIKKEVK